MPGVILVGDSGIEIGHTSIEINSVSRGPGSVRIGVLLWLRPNDPFSSSGTDDDAFLPLYGFRGRH